MCWHRKDTERLSGGASVRTALKCSRNALPNITCLKIYSAGTSICGDLVLYLIRAMGWAWNEPLHGSADLHTFAKLFRFHECLGGCGLKVRSEKSPSG